jgi:hypothetical protein
VQRAIHVRYVKQSHTRALRCQHGGTMSANVKREVPVRVRNSGNIPSEDNEVVRNSTHLLYSPCGTNILCSALGPASARNDGHMHGPTNFAVEL